MQHEGSGEVLHSGSYSIYKWLEEMNSSTGATYLQEGNAGSACKPDLYKDFNILKQKCLAAAIKTEVIIMMKEMTVCSLPQREINQ